MNSEMLLVESEKSEDQQGWLATFADLMSLLMCFFVLLLSFSELDVIKFQQIAGSMKVAFGVQREVEADAIPLGTSVIAQEFSPTLTEPTLLDEVRQPRQQEMLPALRHSTVGQRAEQQAQSRRQGAMADVVGAIQRELPDALSAGQFELDHQGQQLIIRIPEYSSFAAGSGFLQPQFEPLLTRLAALLAQIPGQVEVAGHTDDRPVANELFADNLALSAQRAMAVARVLKAHPLLNSVRVTAWGSAQPLNDNDTTEHRAQNRRVEIMLTQGKPKQQALPAGLLNEE
ncbi:OmpA family protein [Aestuariibacter halophilus]|uniref:OmpA family protein n=2 Tax=Fluctibacter halophilus TaxID=226011 RepID=A0ABS8G6Z0_9ALTE|nr:OmpA family protein [Aestuariibacter halophilus]